MKRIHLILVNKAVASLYHCSNTRNLFTTRQTSDDLLYEVYITSDEEVKEKDSFYDLTTKKVFYACKDMLTWRHDTKEKHKNWEKIILTTDQDLIKDGVQAIDDDFLEWFVKNPSCEEVDVVDLYVYPNVIHTSYKMVIPKEEPKQETLEEAAEKFIKLLDFTSLEIDDKLFEAILFGANWQAERMASEK